MTTPSAPRISEDELARLAEAAERIRSHHDRTLGHSPTNRIGYCAEPDGISATYCETGILIAAARSAPAAGLDVERLATALHLHGDCPLCNDEAERIVAEYAALTAEEVR